MEFIVSSINGFFLLIFTLSPFFLKNKTDRLQIKNKFLFYFIIALLLSFAVTTLFAWWANYSDELLLKHYGYNFEGMNDMETYVNVSAKDIERVKELVRSNSGIGWPVKTLIISPFVFLYMLVVYLMYYFLKRIINKN